MSSLPLLRLAPLAIALAVAGCTVGPDYVRPAAPLPEKFVEAAGAAVAPVNREWWKLFDDATLNGLVEQALQANADVQLAAARVEEADAFLREAGSALLPEIDLAGSGTRSRSSANTVPALPADMLRHNNFKATLGTSFEIDFWGKLRRATEAARDLALASHYGRDTVELTLVGLLTQSYLGLRALDAQLAVSRDTLITRDKSLAISQHRFTAGLASELDVRQAESARAAIAAQIADLVQQRAAAQHQLALLTANPGLTLAAGDFSKLPLPPIPPAGLPSALLDARPDVRQAEAQLAAANARIGVAKAALFPTISLTASLGSESTELANLFRSGSNLWSGGLGLMLPIFDAGRQSARVDQATAQQKQALAGYSKAVQTAFKEVDDALVGLRQAGEKERAVETQAKAAARVLSLAEARYQAGYSPYLELLDAQRSANDANLTLIRTRQARLSAAVDLFKALGGGWNATVPLTARAD
ncbi:MAG: efflux transporter outer membrane subunit [Sulfuricella sp.]|nr:efflux transporter outer membrane subunit [Sulfuricella sp.]